MQVPGAFAYSRVRRQGSEENGGFSDQLSPKDPSACGEAIHAVNVPHVTPWGRGLWLSRYWLSSRRIAQWGWTGLFFFVWLGGNGLLFTPGEAQTGKPPPQALEPCWLAYPGLEENPPCHLSLSDIANFQSGQYREPGPATQRREKSRK